MTPARGPQTMFFGSLMVVESLLCNFKRKSKHVPKQIGFFLGLGTLTTSRGTLTTSLGRAISFARSAKTKLVCFGLRHPDDEPGHPDDG